jgi:hypothetical protein
MQAGNEGKPPFELAAVQHETEGTIAPEGDELLAAFATQIDAFVRALY